MNKTISTTIGTLIVLLVAGIVGASVLFFSQEDEKEKKEIVEEGFNTEEKLEYELEREEHNNSTEGEVSMEMGDNNKEEKDTENKDIRFCKTTRDCHLVYCLNSSSLNEKIKKAHDEGIITDYTPIPTNTSCVCQKSKCTVVVNQDKRDEIREKMNINEGLESFYNLISYNSNIKTDYIDEELAEIGRFDITIDESILKDENVSVLNINLPGDLNVVVDREGFFHKRNQIYVWKGMVRGGSNFSQVSIIVSDEGVSSTITGVHTDNIENSKEKYVYIITSDRLIVLENSSSY